MQPGLSRRTRDRPRRDQRVVIADDSPACCAVIRELLERRGYRVAAEAHCGTTVIELVDLLTPEAVLLDVHLPLANGFEVAARLHGQYPELAVLLTSADVQSCFHALAERSGARGFVPKSQLASVPFELFWSPRS